MSERVAPGVVSGATAGFFGQVRERRVGPDWFKRAVFYEVLVRAFSDSNRDGSGDLRGLTEKLDYLKWLGVDCLLLPPLHDSPLRDGGYDIRDFRAVLAEFGTVEDFVYFLAQAHKRGIRVITDLVMNHTSDTHPWFQDSRRNPDGPYGDFYVWSDDSTRYPDARIIFVDTESSNWTYCPVRGQFYWHRFFSHQPDLNYDNRAVADAMIDVLRFWLDLGIDGFRLDAVSYLFEREGTNCENLPETHAFLRRCRKVIDDEYPGRVLLVEADQWPTDVVEYFGDAGVGGDECHMAFHFPLMPRIFMAVRRESRFPISEILAQTPPIPSGCQWGIFLRNHDELTLEMVSDDERDYMYAEYAKDPRMKANIGIRRRLAPLLDNDRNQLELFTALLLSLPGSPVLYYGDEIGMGDNIWLGDRDAVRGPMHWTPDRNAGFSFCDPGRLYLPIIMDPLYGYQAVNVEAQIKGINSLLHWNRRMIEIRKQHATFGLGKFHELGASNPSVLAYIREHHEPDGSRDVVLCVNNMSRLPQPVELDLGPWRGCTPVELTGGAPFPPIGELPYLLTLPGHGFYWFAILAQEQPVSAVPDRLADWLPAQRWFAAKGRAIAGVHVAQSVTLADAQPRAEHIVLRVEFADGGPPQHYQLLLGRRGVLPPELQHATIGTVDDDVGYDGLWDPQLTQVVLDLLAREQQVGPLRFVLEPGAQLPHDVAARMVTAEQSNSCVVYGEQAILKLFRRVTPGLNPDLELHRALREVGCTHVAQLLGAIEGSLHGEPASFGILQQYAANSVEGWTMALVSVRDLLAEADLRADEVGGDFASEAYRLGKVVAAVHADLATALGVSTLDSQDLAAVSDGMTRRLEEALSVVPELAELAPALRSTFRAVAAVPPGVSVQRVHGDLHLGQALRTPTGWLLIDFEGEPAKPLAQRSAPHSPLRDIAGMLRSFDYAAYHQLAEWQHDASDPSGQLQYRAQEWAVRNREAFCDGYTDVAGADPRSSQVLLRAYELDKAVYETVYETRYRPSWAQIPLRSLRHLVAN
jgi:maltose alpha-D-glucosyltransferase/alpha-amylase